MGILPSSEPTNQKVALPEKQKTQQEYVFISDRIDSIVGKPRLVKSNIKNTELQEYYVSNPQSTIQSDANIYKLRSSTYSNNVAIVFHHKLINEAQKLFMVRIQKMKGRLSQIQGVSYIQAMCLLEASLNGFSQLVYHAKTPFVITQKMIALNENSFVRVWLNENYALNKIMPGIKIRNQNIMIHQIFSAVAEHVAFEQRQVFANVRFKIAQCQRIIQAKNIITMIIMNCNRRAVLQELASKQIMKLNNKQNFKQPQSPINYSLSQNPMLGTLPNQGTPQNPLSPINPMITTVSIESGPERIHLQAQQYIKDDENSDRIRMFRQQPNSSIPAFSNISPNVTNPNIPNINVNIISNGGNLPIIYNKGKDVVYDFAQQQPVLVNGKRQSNRNPKISSATLLEQAPQTPMKKQQQKGVIVAANNTDRSNNRTTSIFAPKAEQQNIDRVKSPRAVSPRPVSPNIVSPRGISPRAVSPRAVSPIKQKPIVVEHSAQKPFASTNNLTTKIALSENKISQMEKKISKLKEEFTKNNERYNHHKETQQYSDIIIKKDQNNKLRMATTPQHSNNRIVNEERPLSKFEKEKYKTETAIGETAAKWDKKLNDLIRQGQEATNNAKENQNIIEKERKRKSQILIDDQQKISYLRKSMITELPSSLKAEFAVASTPTNRQDTGKAKDDFIIDTPKRDVSPSFHQLQQNAANPNNNNKNNPPNASNGNMSNINNSVNASSNIGNINSMASNNNYLVGPMLPLISNPNGLYMGTIDKNGGFRIPQPQQPKMQINFNGNPLVTRVRNGYGIVENKSLIFPKTNYF